MVFFICHGLYRYFEYLFVIAPTGQTADNPRRTRKKECVPFGHHLIEAALFHELERVDHQHVLADVDAFRARDAAVHIEVQHQAAGIFRNEFLFGIGQIGDAVPECHVLQFAMAVGIAHRAIQRMDGQMFFDGLLPCLEEVIAFRSTIRPAVAFAVQERTGAFFPSSMTKHMPQEPKGSNV